MAPQTWALPLGCAVYVPPRPIPFQRVLLAQCCPQTWVKRIPASHPNLLYPTLGLKGEGRRNGTVLYSCEFPPRDFLSGILASSCMTWRWVSGSEREDLFGYLMVRPEWMCLELLFQTCGDFSFSYFQI